ncbi:amino acid ABC transporter permease [Mesorhizobium sp. KR1-2]|uniref:amino acid ABC transporter permease n=1 Tax=Mesorhizobium sp. KR1-2 TaxID=3156609 RepID=UPI0032B59C26
MRGLISFLRQCVSTPLNIAISLAICLWLGLNLAELTRWAIIDAVWSGASPQACAGVDAACWLFIKERFGQILYGTYPREELWRVVLCGIAGLGLLVVFSLPWRRGKLLAVLATLIVFPVFAGIMLRGGIFGLTVVPTTRWGGMLLTVVIAAWTIATTLPLGLAVALARRSKLPVVAAFAACYIDLMRGLPLVGILFIAIVLFPLFVPPGMDIDALVRTLIAFALFNAANMAEVIRGGIQAVPRGQYEAAMALGLRHWQAMALTIIPQAVRAAMPGIVNVSVAIIKETTIVLIAGMFDFLGVLHSGLIDPAWIIGDQVRETAYFFAGVVFFVVCFGLSRYSARIERKLDVGRQ